jgi:hypothetical protein
MHGHSYTLHELIMNPPRDDARFLVIGRFMDACSAPLIAAAVRVRHCCQ